jgi:hypothetical protein
MASLAVGLAPAINEHILVVDALRECAACGVALAQRLIFFARLGYGCLAAINAALHGSARGSGDRLLRAAYEKQACENL